MNVWKYVAQGGTLCGEAKKSPHDPSFRPSPLKAMSKSYKGLNIGLELHSSLYIQGLPFFKAKGEPWKEADQLFFLIKAKVNIPCSMFV